MYAVLYAFVGDFVARTRVDESDTSRDLSSSLCRFPLGDAGKVHHARTVHIEDYKRVGVRVRVKAKAHHVRTCGLRRRLP